MEFTDRVLKCADCGAEFVFTAGEQVFFHDKQFKNDPKHCKQCKAKRARGSQRVRPETRTTCSECGTETTVPFKPTQGRPVLCRSCFQKQVANPTREQETTAAQDLRAGHSGSLRETLRCEPAWQVAPSGAGRGRARAQRSFFAKRTAAPEATNRS